MFKKLLFDFEVTTKNELFDAIVRYMSSLNIVKSSSVLIEELHQREIIGNSMIAEAVALPHIESQNIKESTVIFVRLQKPIKGWDSKNNSASVFLFLLIKENETQTLLQPVKALMKLLADDKTIATLVNGNEKQIEKILSFL